MKEGETAHHWTLDRRIPLALILALVVQAAGAFWWAGRIDERVAKLERSTDVRVDERDRIIRLEEGVLSIKTILAKIDRKLEQIDRRGTP